MQAGKFLAPCVGVGKPFPQVQNVRVTIARDGSQTVRFSVKSPVDIKPAAVYYSPSKDPWKPRKWIKVDAARRGKSYEASVPAKMDCIAMVTDSRPVTVSSEVLLWNSKSTD